MPTLRAYRRATAPEFGRLAVVETTAEATGDEAERRIVSDALLGVDLGPTTLSQRWAYVVDGVEAGEQRRLTTAPLDGELGELTAVSGWDTVIASGVEVELHGPIPAIRDPLGIDGWREYINRGLSKLRRRFAVSVAATGAYRYALTAHPWLIDTGLITGIRLDTGSSVGNALPLPAGWEVVYDGESAYLETDATYGSPNAFVLETLRSADTRIKRAGVWTDTAGGPDDALVDDDDEALVPVGVVRVLAIREALAARHQWAPHGEREAWQVQERLYAMKAAAAARRYAGADSRVMMTRTLGRAAPWGWVKGFLP